MPVRHDTYVYQGSRLPHLRKLGKTYFVTFCTRRRWVMPGRIRDVVLESCVREHEVRCWLHCVVVMPDHVHLIVHPYEVVALSRLVGEVKGRSSFLADQKPSGRGALWQRDSFDYIIRAGENLQKKIQYVCDNPVWKGIVAKCDDYRWLWRAWSVRSTAA